MKLFELFGVIDADNQPAKKAIDETIDKAEQGKSRISSSFSSISGAAGKMALGLGTVGLALGGSLVAAIESTREYRTEMGKLETAFTTAGHSTENAKTTYSELNAILGDSNQAVEAANHLALLTDNAKDLQTWTDICTGVYATFGASLPVEGLTEAANHTAKLGEVQGSLADALEWAGITVDDFNVRLAQCGTEQERQALITETLNGLYSEAATKYKEVNKDVIEAEKAQARLTEVMAKVGEVGEPVLTALKNALASLAEKAIPLIESLIEKIQEASRWVKENQDTVQALVTVVIAATGAILAYKAAMTAMSIIKTITSAIKGMTIAQYALNLAMSLNPIGLIVSLIAALVAAFLYLWNNCEGFRNFWIGLWEGIKAVFQTFADWIGAAIEVIKGFFSALWDKIKEIWQAIIESLKPLTEFLVQAFKVAWEAIKAVWDVVSSYFKTLWESITAVFSVVKTFFSGMFKAAWEAIKAVWNAVTGYFKAVWDTIAQIFSVVKNVLTGNWSEAWEGIKGIVGTWQKYFSGVWDSIKKVFSVVKDWFSDTFKAAWEAIKKVFAGWGDFFGGLWDTIKEKFSSLGSKISNAIGSAIKTGINGVISLIEGVLNSGIRGINGAIGLINEIPGVNISGIDKLSLPRLAKGGILDKGQVGLLEGSGAEAVVPLEHNDEWLAALADKYNQIQVQNGVTVSKEADERLYTMLTVIIKSLEQLTDLKLYLDSGVLVGELAPQLDRKLGDLSDLRKRGR